MNQPGNIPHPAMAAKLRGVNCPLTADGTLVVSLPMDRGMIPVMGRYTWGKTAAALVLAVTVVAMSGCSNSADEDSAKPTATAKTVSLKDATTTFQDTVTQFDTGGGCLEEEPGTCWDQMQALVEPARTLRKAMNTEKSVSADFWSPAYELIDTMEDGISVGEDKGATVIGTNRPDVLGSAHDLSDWLDENPIR